jgi:uncharacterized protein YjbI with pentapeptide repeats
MYYKDRIILGHLKSIESNAINLLNHLKVSNATILTLILHYNKTINLEARKLDSSKSHLKSIPNIDEVKQIKNSISSIKAASLQIYSNLDDVKRLKETIKKLKLKKTPDLNRIKNLNTKIMNYLKGSIRLATSAVNESKKSVKLFEPQNWLNPYFLNKDKRYYTHLEKLLNRRGYYSFLTLDQVFDLTKFEKEGEFTLGERKPIETIALEGSHFNELKLEESDFSITDVTIINLISINSTFMSIKSKIKECEGSIRVSLTNSKIRGKLSLFKSHFECDLYPNGNCLNSNLNDLNLISTNKNPLEFNGCIFENVAIKGIRNLNFTNCKFNKTFFKKTTLENCKFSKCHFDVCSFIETTLENTIFENCTFNKINISFPIMEGKSSDLSKLVRVGVGGTMALIESSKEGALSKTTPTGALSDPTQDAPEETQVEIPKEEQSWIGRLLGTKRRKK